MAGVFPARFTHRARLRWSSSPAPPISQCNCAFAATLPVTGRLVSTGFSHQSRQFFSLNTCCHRSDRSATMGVEISPMETVNSAPVTVIKAPSDEREYEVLRLRNGIVALLIHDPHIKLASGGDRKGEKRALESADEDGEDDEDDEGSEDGDDEDTDDTSSVTEDGHVHVHGEHCTHELHEHGDCDGMEASELDDDDDDDDDDDEDEGAVAHGGTGSMAPTKKAAAAMCVGVGSFSDPEDAQGLAHFLEHMLFMGSSKFPDENEYDDFLSKHGGGSNAFTDTEYTCYHFDVNHNYLKPALDRFSQFFIAPLAKADAMDREVQAIESEFNQVLQSDSCRLLQLQCHTAHSSHPFNSFSWGNRKSLSEPIAKGVDVRAKLLELYKQHYLAGRMKLTVLGGESLETLKSWVVELFDQVKVGGEKRLQFPWEGAIWQPGRMYRVESVKEQHLLSLIWPLPCLDHAYLKKPQDYISHLIGHEGAGSLLSLLKSKGWAIGLSAGVGEGGHERSSAGYMFNINIQLTDLGSDKVLDVIGLVFQYFKMLRKVGPQEWVFQELQAMAMMEFKFAEEESADNYTVRLATNMHCYSEEHIVYGDYAFEEWDPVLVEDLLALLTPSNMRVDILTKPFDRNGSDVIFEPWFEVPYTVEIIPTEVLAAWADPVKVDKALCMPVINEFIPRDFSLRCGDKSSSPGDSSEVPEILLDESGMKVWFKMDKTFRTPRANTYFSVTTKTASESIVASVLTDVYVKILEDALNETIYLANVAKLESSLTISGDKLEIKLFGFSEKLPVLAKKIGEMISTLVPKADRFQVVKEELEKAYRNANMKPLKHSAYLRLQILKERFWCIEDKLAVLLTLTVDDLLAFIPRLFQETFIEGLCHGNLTKEEALNIANIFKTYLVKKELPKELRYYDRIVELPSESSFLHSTVVKNDLEENSVVEVYFQAEQDFGEKSIRARGLVDLFEQIAYEPCFNQLRTKEQLGYRVDCGVRITYRVFGFCFRVQSAKYSPSHLQQRIDAFTADLKQILEELDDEEFQNYKESLIAGKLEKDHSLANETERHWEQIWDQRYLFDARKLEAADVRDIKKAEVVNWYSSFLAASSPSRRKLMVHVWGCNTDQSAMNSAVGDGTVRIEDIQAFKKGSKYFDRVD